LSAITLLKLGIFGREKSPIDDLLWQIMEVDRTVLIFLSGLAEYCARTRENWGLMLLYQDRFDVEWVDGLPPLSLT